MCFGSCRTFVHHPHGSFWCLDDNNVDHDRIRVALDVARSPPCPNPACPPPPNQPYPSPNRADPTPSSDGLDDVSSDGSGHGGDFGSYSYNVGYDTENLEQGYGNTNTNGHADDGLERIAGVDADDDGAPRTAGAGTQKEQGGEGLGSTVSPGEGPDDDGDAGTAAASETVTLESGSVDEGGGTTAVSTASGDHGR